MDLSEGRLPHVTVTQGLAKFLFGYEPGFLSKGRVLAMSLTLDRRIAKRDQLRVFINQVYMGADTDGEIRGFAAASREYFNRVFDGISDEQFLTLLAMLSQPGPRNVATHPDANAAWVARLRPVVEGHCSATEGGA